MTPTLTAGLIYTALAILYLIAVHGISFRLIHIDRHLKLCPQSSLFQITNGRYENWDDVRGNWGCRSGLGWLNECLSQRVVHSADSLAEEISLQSDTYLNVLTLVCTLSTLFGLLGTVSGFLVSEEVSAIGLNVAFRTTFWGILIGIPPAIYLGFTKQKRDRFDRQLDAFQQFCEKIAAQTNAATSVTPLTGLPGIQMADLDAKVVDTAFAAQSPSPTSNLPALPQNDCPTNQRWLRASS